MQSIKVSLEKRHPNAQVPKYATLGSSGADLCAVENDVLLPGERKLISTGIAVAIPDGYEIQIRPRSGLALKKGITVVNSPGSIDSDYRGVLGVILLNTGKEMLEIKVGDKIAQAILAPVVQAAYEETDKLDDTERGSGGFGHTGVR